MNRKIALSAAIIVIVLVGLIAVISYTGLGGNGKEQKPFHVGVTYGGNNTQDAKTLIDKVKTYTNLFVIQSGPLMKDEAAITEIGDYAVDAGLDVMVSFGSVSISWMQDWLETYDGHWGNHLAGIYFDDEPAGKMIDSEMSLFQDGNGSFRKMADRRITGVYFDENISDLDYYPDGKIVAHQTWQRNEITQTYQRDDITYYPNGTIVTTINPISGGPAISSKEGTDLPYTYEELWNARPLQTIDETAETYVNTINQQINLAKNYSQQFNFNSFLTSDYALYWFDYKGGYDTVLAQLGWNNTVAQEIGLVRGAANLQGKSWGTIITWKYMQAPYLTDGDEMFEQMKASYEAGAEYVLVFNYAEDMTGPYGTLQEQHFQALEHFWNEHVAPNNEKAKAVKAEAALVLPENYGWGMRRPDDSIWGLWDANGTSTQIWSQLQQRLDQYGAKLDIVYDDPAFPVEGKYGSVYYWDTPNP